MIRQVSIKGFKSVHDQTIELGRVNCFIGANGTGKSNVLEALGVLGAAANGVVDDESLLRRGVRAGLPRLYKSSFAADPAPPHITIGAVSESGASYRIALLNPLYAPEPAWSFKTEVLSDGTEPLSSVGVRNPPKNPQASLAALRLVDLDPANPAAVLMKTLQSYAIYCPHTPVLRGIVPDQQPRVPAGLNGGLLAEGFRQLQEDLAGEAGEALLDQLMELIDWVSDIQATSQGAALLSPKVPRTAWMLKFTDRFMNGSRNTLTAYDASEGALYVIFTALLCLSPRAPRLLAIDNLDQALNPRLVSRLVSCLSGWLSSHSSGSRQLLFTAHNPAVLDGLSLEDPEVRLFTVDRNSHGHTSIRRLEMTEALFELNQTYPLSRLWLMGNLGAVPHV
ncbi:MAG: AAA family ATPase [Bacteroidia bacterium]|nr:AAA family ATPase [Bacteroidia bacterium]